MADLIQIALPKESGRGYSLKNNDTLLRNLLASSSGADSKNEFVIVNTEGTEKVGEVNSTILGIHEFKDTIYVATDKMLLRFNGKEFVFVASVDFYQKVYMEDNGIDIMMVGGNGFAYTPETNTIKNMDTEEGWYKSSMVAYMDGYFIFNREETGQFFISKLYSTELNPIDWATAESSPDDTVGLIVANRSLWLFGERSAEVWYDSGNRDFPFTRISGAVIDIGAVTPDSISKIRDSVIFVGNDYKVYATSGYIPQAISTPAIEKVLDEGNTSQIRSFTYSNEGHWFYVLHLNNNITYVYDLTMGVWHNRSTGDMGKWMIDGAFNRNRNNTPIGYHENKIYMLSLYKYTDDGIPIKREIITPPVNRTVNRFRIHELMLDMEVAEGEDGEMELKTSSDGGRTWSNSNKTPMGKDGQHHIRVRWVRLGSFRDCVLNFTTFAQSRIRIIGMWGRFS